MWNTPDLYVSIGGAPFELNGMGKRIVFVSSRQHMKDMGAAPESQLSLHAFLDEVCDLFLPSFNSYGLI